MPRKHPLILGGIALVAILALVITMVSCGGAKTSATYQGPDAADFSQMSWTEAFDQLSAKMQREYAFTEWKGVDWTSLTGQFHPIIEQAQAEGDFEGYYLALKDFLGSIPDGHINLSGNDRGVIYAKVGGGFGIVGMALDDSRIVAVRVTPGSPADAAGIKAGAELVSWGGVPALDALAQTSTVFTRSSIATDEDYTYQQLRFMVRAPVGATEQVAFKNTGDSTNTTVTLTAVNDGGETLEFTNPNPGITNIPDSTVKTQILPGNIGYVWVWGEVDLPETVPGDHTPTAELFKQAIDSFVAANVSGIVVDVRGNLGGSDSMVAQFMSSFYEKQTVYEYQNWYNAVSGKFEIWLSDDATGEMIDPGKSLDIVPASPRYDGPVVVLVDTGCVSSGEGVAMGIRNLPNGKVVGFFGTNGSFGMAGDTALLPEGLAVSFPYGQSLDKNKVVQLDSRDGVGGVAPTNRIPMTLENALKWGAGEDVELEWALQALAGPH